MTDNEKIISDISYTNKDFNSIYNELLDTVKKLTNKWDPSLSNESDPGVLLLKLNAIIADKNNYNIDKNVLECFPLSVTQQGNARKIYDLLGYNMNWYESAITDINFQLLPNSGLDAGDTVNIPIFTMVTNSDSDITYTILQDVKLNMPESNSLSNSNNTIISTVKAIEGTIHTFEIDGEENLTLDNLDSDLRLYFNETQIAQNGIFITTGTEWTNINEWTRVDNIASYPNGNKIYQFGVLPNTDTCYIQFPSDIANLITNTFKVKYIISSGVNGNIKSFTINSFLNDEYADNNKELLYNDIVKISQPSIATGGKDIETLDEAYRNYKRSLGIFNTLVTNQDYENYIYNMKNYLGIPLVSNLRVSDRTNDLNFSNHIMVWEPNEESRKLLLTDNPDLHVDSSIELPPKLKDIIEKYTAQMLPFDLYLYLLNYTTPTGSKNDLKFDNYNKGFKLAEALIRSQNNEIIHPDPALKTLIEGNINKIKSIQHDVNLITNIENASKSFFNNLYELSGQVTTYYKVTSNEAIDIQNNIIDALLQKYQARQVVFGEQIDYNDLVETIKNSDSRINNVILNTPNYAVQKQNLLGELDNMQPSDNIELIARMVLAGNVQLFKFDDNFVYDFGQTNGRTITGTTNDSTNIKSITTSTNVNIVVGDNQLQENEILQFISPSYINTKEYSTYVKYSYTQTSEPEEGAITTIPKNTDFTLPNNVNLTFNYIDSNNLTQTESYNSGTIIYSTKEIQLGSSGTLSTGDSITIKEKNEKTISQGIKYVFVLNNGDFNLPVASSYILQENEYFIYTDEAESDLVILGSGTEITNIGSEAIKQPAIQLDLENFQSNINEVDWIDLTYNQSLKIGELNIYTIGSSGSIKSDITINNIGNNYQEVDLSSGNITLISLNGDQTKLSPLPGNDKWRVRSRLNINSSPNKPQLLLPNQQFTFNMEDGSIVSSSFEEAENQPKNQTQLDSGNYYILDKDNNIFIKATDYEQSIIYFEPKEVEQSLLFNYPIQIAGGENINTQVITLNGTEYIKCYEYKASTEQEYPFSRTNNILSIKGSDITATLNLPFTFEANTRYIIPVKIVSDEGTLTINGSSYDKGVNYIQIDSTSNLNNLTIVKGNNFTDSDSIDIGYISKIDGYNSDEVTVEKAYNDADNFNLDDVNGLAIEAKITEILGNSSSGLKFNLTYRVKPQDKVLKPTLSTSYFNQNHIYNRYTIPQIDTSKLDIKVNQYYIQ